MSGELFTQKAVGEPEAEAFLSEETQKHNVRRNPPVHDVMEYEAVQFDNAFWKPSPYKGKPTPELEAKWKELWYYGSFDLPSSALPALNKSPNGVGVGGVAWARTASGNLLAGLEVVHNLHCLNLVRHYVHKDDFDYSSDPAFIGDDEIVLA
ncbi:Cyclochlorotine biosynthesis protein O, partial [Colletotrichum shisoi]